MKKLVFLNFLLILCLSSFAQRYTYKSYGMELPNLNTAIQYQPDIIEVGVEGENYIITIYKNEEMRMGAVVKYNSSSKEEGTYLYIGSLTSSGEYYKCAISTNHELSEFAKGIGNSNKVTFNEDYSIRIYYGKDVKTPDDLTLSSFFYPIK